MSKSGAATELLQFMTSLCVERTTEKPLFITTRCLMICKNETIYFAIDFARAAVNEARRIAVNIAKLPELYSGR